MTPLADRTHETGAPLIKKLREMRRHLFMLAPGEAAPVITGGRRAASCTPCARRIDMPPKIRLFIACVTAGCKRAKKKAHKLPPYGDLFSNGLESISTTNVSRPKFRSRGHRRGPWHAMINPWPRSFHKGRHILFLRGFAPEVARIVDIAAALVFRDLRVRAKRSRPHGLAFAPFFVASRLSGGFPCSTQASRALKGSMPI